MKGHSTSFYVVVFFGSSVAALFTIYMALLLFPDIRYFTPPATLIIGYFKPFCWRASLKNVISLIVFLVVSYLFIYLTIGDNIMSVLSIVTCSYMYLGYIKDRQINA